jgi:putative ATP-dependent endonuclease of the OLD family
MRIKNLKVHNFRSIREMEIECQALMVLLGPNNHGKSNVLSALGFFLTGTAKIDRQDLFDFESRTDDVIWVEVTFVNLTPQERKTFEKYILSDGCLRIRKTATFDADKGSVKYQGWAEEPQEDWLKNSNAGDYTNRATCSATGLSAYVPAGGKLSKALIEEAQNKYITDHRTELTLSIQLEDGPLLGQKAVAQGVLPEFYLVPAIRDLSDETKIQNTALLGRLVNRAIELMGQSDSTFQEIQNQFQQQIARLNERDGEDQPKIEQIREIKAGIESELKSWRVKVHLEIDTPPLDKIFQLGTNLHIDDGLKTLADRKGHGLQRALIFALLKTWAKFVRKQAEGDGTTKPRASSDSVYFAIEEPELFLHPQAQREFAESLATLSETDGVQVFLCTHSSHFVDMERYRSICLVSKHDPSQGSQIRQCTVDLFPGEEDKAKKDRLNMAYWINPDRGEMFFGRRAVFVEGVTEKSVLPFLGEKMRVFDNEVSIIDCGAKHNLPLYVTIANAFALDYVVVHDEDPLPDPIPDDWTADKRQAKQNTFALNATIASAVNRSHGQAVVLSPEFETVAGVSKTQGDKKGKALAALDHFETKNIDELPSVIRNLVNTVYG